MAEFEAKCPLCDDTFLILAKDHDEFLKIEGKFAACPKCDPEGLAKEGGSTVNEENKQDDRQTKTLNP